MSYINNLTIGIIFLFILVKKIKSCFDNQNNKQ